MTKASFSPGPKPLKSVGAELARDEAITFTIIIDCEAAIASKLGSYRRGIYFKSTKKTPRTSRGVFVCSETARCYLPAQRFSTSVALVPPKPKLLLITVLMVAFSRVLVRIGMSATSGSSSSMLAEPAMKLPSIISMQ